MAYGICHVSGDYETPLRLMGSPQPRASKKQGSQFHNHRELNFANSLSELGGGFFLSQTSKCKCSLLTS